MTQNAENRAIEWQTKIKTTPSFPQYVKTVEPLRVDYPGFDIITDLLAEMQELKQKLYNYEEAVDMFLSGKDKNGHALMYGEMKEEVLKIIKGV